MKLNKDVQYGFLLTMYLARAGRSNIYSIADNLGMSSTFLSQVARKLRVAGVIKSSRGPGGGYELNGRPTVGAVFSALMDTPLFIEKDEMTELSKGEVEERAFAHLIRHMGSALSPVFNMPVADYPFIIGSHANALTTASKAIN